MRILPVLAVVFFAGCGGGDFEGYKYKPYVVKGVRYEPMHPEQAVGFVEEGIASHYNESWFLFPGPTALGENNWPWSYGGAHKTLPIPCRVRVTNLRNNRSVVIRINDRGPFVPGRILDVTHPVAKDLGFYSAGLAPVRIEVLSVGDGRHRIKHRAPVPGVVPGTVESGGVL